VPVRQGEVWWANLPEPLGWRPVSVLTRDSAIERLHWVTVAPLTRTIRNIGPEFGISTFGDGSVPSGRSPESWSDPGE
jgi:mRNA interferase MazF